MEELDTPPPVPHIEFETDALPVERKQQIAALTANLVRAATGDDAFAELWLAQTLGDAMVDADTAALVLCDLADMAVMLLKTVAASRELPAADVIDLVASTWEAKLG